MTPFDDLVKNKTITNKSINSYEKFFNNLAQSGELLTPEQTDQVLQIISKPQNLDKSSYILKYLTKHHLLTKEQVDLVIELEYIKKNNNTQKKMYNGSNYMIYWFDNLKRLGYHITEDQFTRLCECKYFPVYKDINVKNIFTKRDLDALCIIINNQNIQKIIPKITEIVEKFHLVPDINTFKNYYESLRKINYYSEMSHEIENENHMIFRNKCISYIFEWGLEMTIDILKILEDHKIQFTYIEKYIEKLFMNNQKDLVEVDFLFDIKKVNFAFLASKSASKMNTKIYLNFFDNISLITSLCKKYQVVLNIKNLYNLNIPFFPITNQQEFEDSYEINNKSIIHAIDKTDSRKLNLTYRNIIQNFLSNNYTIEQLQGLLENVCLTGDILAFDVITEHFKEFSNKCVDYACASENIYILKKLFEMKAFPTIENVKNLKYRAHDFTVKLLLDNGLKLNHEIVEILFTKEIYIDNLLVEHDYIVGMDLYKICYKYNRFPEIYTKQLEAVPNLFVDIRLAIYYCYDTKNCIKLRNKNMLQISESDIIKMIETQSIEPDITMYNHAVIANKQELVKYFENKYNMQPNLETLVLIENLSKRRQYLERIVSYYNLDVVITGKV